MSCQEWLFSSFVGYFFPKSQGKIWELFGNYGIIVSEKIKRSYTIKIKIKTVCKGKTLYRLTYTLEDSLSGFRLLIRSEEFDRNSYLFKKGTPPRFSEESFTALTDFSREDAEKLFSELSENLVFPCSLMYIMEDNF